MVEAWRVQWCERWYSAYFLYRNQAEFCRNSGYARRPESRVIQVRVENTWGSEVIQLAHGPKTTRSVWGLARLDGHLYSEPGPPVGDVFRGYVYILGTWHVVQKPVPEAHWREPWQEIGVYAHVRPWCPPGADVARVLGFGRKRPKGGRRDYEQEF